LTPDGVGKLKEMISVTEVGYVALLIGMVMAAYGVVAALVGARQRAPEWVTSARNATFVVGGLVSVAGLTMLYALVSHDFGVKYVVSYTSRDLPLFYTVAAFWAGQDGSLLLWAWLLAGIAVAVVIQNRGRNGALLPYVIAVLLGTETFFLTMLLFASNPFARLPVPLPDGQGLNPLLQNLGMVFHPVATYVGYVGFTVPFAFAVAALVTGRLDATWIRTTRRWTLVSWLFLSIGIGLGAQWAYVELGWGGYWAWDPVENASLMPWLTATAYLHSGIIQERRGMLKVWNIVLIMLTFALTLVGTFITRSGIIESVHAFGVSTLGPYFLAFLALTVLGFLFLLFERWSKLQSENALEGLVSRESSFLLNNLLLAGGAFAVLWGTLLPLVAEAVVGQKIAVSAPYFNQVAGPIFLAIVALLGICPLLAWRRTRPNALLRHLLWPVVGSLLGVVVFFLLGIRDPLPLIAMAVCAFGLGTIGLEFWRSVRAQRRMTGEPPWISLRKLLRRQPRRYGGYLVHLGILLTVIGIVGSSLSQDETTVSLAPGESMSLGAYTLEYVGLENVPARTHQKVLATLRVYRNGRFVGVLVPEKDFHSNWPEPTTEVAIRTTLLEDLYVILSYWEEGGQLVTFKAVVNPLVAWMWIGGTVLVLGTLVAVWPAPQSVPSEQRSSRVRGLSGASGKVKLSQ
jgi:cytochrome c-type biogenesis protein CcmF